MNSLQTIYEQLHLRGLSLDLYREEDYEKLYEIFRNVVEAGTQFPYEESSYEEFRRRFFEPGSQIYVCRSKNEGVIGGFYLKANYPGRAKHIANAAYMLDEKQRGKGLGMLLGKASLLLAKAMGFQAMQFNMVLSQNLPAVNLYKKLGFAIIATIPRAIRNPDGSLQKGYIMYTEIK